MPPHHLPQSPGVLLEASLVIDALPALLLPDQPPHISAGAGTPSQVGHAPHGVDPVDLPLGAHHQLQALGAGLLLLLRQHVRGKVNEPALVEDAGLVVVALGGDTGLGEAVQHIGNILYSLACDPSGSSPSVGLQTLKILDGLGA